MMLRTPRSTRFFFFNDTATTEIYTLSLHDALPIYRPVDELRVQSDGRSGDAVVEVAAAGPRHRGTAGARHRLADRKSTRLNSSHANISYAVFCLKKKTRPFLY